MITISISQDQVTQTFVDTKGNTVKILKLSGSQCIHCLRVLSTIRNQKDKTLFDIELCDCGAK